MKDPRIPFQTLKNDPFKGLIIEGFNFDNPYIKTRRSRVPAPIDEGEKKSPEGNLWAAVIMQAIMDYQSKPKYTRESQYAEKKRAKDQATYWLFEQSNTGPGSLPWICEQIDLDIYCVRKLAQDRNYFSFWYRMHEKQH